MAVHIIATVLLCVVYVCPNPMRFPRVKAEGQSFYHCISRVVEGRFIFQTTGPGSVEAERFVQLMRRLEAFTGVRILDYVLMANHFHLLCEVPEPKILSEAELLQRIEAGYGPARRDALEQQFARLRHQPDGVDQIQRLPIAGACTTFRSLSKSSKAPLPSGTTAAMAVTEYCGPSALRAF